ncbi:MAG: helicase HerA-like domain-containing protein [Rickettsiales bacterium]
MTLPSTVGQEQLKIVIVGHVDHGKSTLVGRLFYDTDSLPDGKLEQVRQSCKRRGMQFEWSFLMDALQAERDQEITIDTSQIWFKTAKRRYVLIDAPGHKEFLKNMISGASQSEGALLIIDAKEGVREQSRRHGYLLSLLGIRQVAVLINKMDLVDFSEDRFTDVKKEYDAYLRSIGVEALRFVPISARGGDNVAARSDHMEWYAGPTVIDTLDEFRNAAPLEDLPLRLPLQDVYRFDEHKRIFAGRIETGRLRVGDEVIFSPSNKKSHIASIEIWNRPTMTEATAGMSVGFTLEEQIFVERGETVSAVESPPMLTNLFRAKMFWLSDKDLVVGKPYGLHINGKRYAAEIREVERVIDTDDLAHKNDKTVRRNAVAELVVHVRGLAAVDEFTDNAKTGRFMLSDGYEVAGGGNISMQGFADQRVKDEHDAFPDHAVTKERRTQANGHSGAVLWFAGAVGTGKNAMAQRIERRLFAKGMQVFTVDRKTALSGVADNAETEDVLSRRGAAAASLFAEAGMVAIAVLPSSRCEERRVARAYAPDAFHFVHFKTENEEAKGFETPTNADLTLDVDKDGEDACADQLEEYVRRHVAVGAVEKASEDGGNI